MTRIAGFERIAREERHAGIFLTITCPSRFHRYRTVNGGKTVIENPKYDSTETPRTAQTYLAKIWSHIRTHLARDGVEIYGFRIAEPQHDGTPHWHLLLFCAADAAQALQPYSKLRAMQWAEDERTGGLSSSATSEPLKRSGRD